MTPDPLTALMVARAKHYGQVRWYTDEPYINHVERVADTVERSSEFQGWSLAQRDVALCSAYLHDVVEDTDYSIWDVQNAFGNDVAGVVGLLTHHSGTSYDEYLVRVKDDPISRIIKRADMCDNMCTLPFTPSTTRMWEKYTKGIAFLSS
jgi:(p)ppGpp synthase/HD superfamily hydrolase